MRNILVMFLMLTCCCSSAQNKKLSGIVFDADRDYGIRDEDEIYNTLFDLPSGNDTIRSNLVVNSDSLRMIRSTRTELTGDTLRILLYQTDPAYHHKYAIIVVKNMYYIEYDFLTSGEQRKMIIKPIDTKLILNTGDFQRGMEIRGYTEFKGRCVGECWEDKIFIRGNFKAILN